MTMCPDDFRPNPLAVRPGDAADGRHFGGPDDGRKSLGKPGKGRAAGPRPFPAEVVAGPALARRCAFVNGRNKNRVISTTYGRRPDGLRPVVGQGRTGPAFGQGRHVAKAPAIYRMGRPSSIVRRVPSRPTITDVAKLCGVTPATVSRVLNGKKFSVSQAVREKIVATAEKVGYVPDLAARNLNRGETRIIGVFGSPQTHVAEGINEGLIEGCAEVLHAGGYDVFFELGALDRGAPAWRFDGAILIQAPRPDLVHDLDARRVPYVCVNERVGNASANVLADDELGTRRAIDHLRQLGHTRIAYANARATYLEHYSVLERYDTLMASAKARHMKVVPGHDVPFASAKAFLSTAVESKATAVLCYDHRIAVEVLGAAMGMKLRVPQDVSLVCFNDVFPVALMYPPLTTVSVNGRDMGRVGAELLLNSLRKSAGGRAKEIRVAEDLIVRGSTAPPKATG